MSKEIISEILLYEKNPKNQAKLVLWLISWICSIGMISSIDDTRALACAYFLFSLSLFAEFGFGVLDKKHLVASLVHCLFGLTLIAILSLSLLTIFKYGDPNYKYLKTNCIIMLILSIIVLIVILANIILMCISSAITKDDILESESKASRDITAKIYLEKQNNGELGDLSKGDDNNE